MSSVVKIEGFRNRHDKSWVWQEKNPILDVGEIGFAEDLGLFKIGNGEIKFNDLPYFTPAEMNDAMLALEDHINSDHPHSVYDNGSSFVLLYENAKV